MCRRVPWATNGGLLKPGRKLKTEVNSGWNFDRSPVAGFFAVHSGDFPRAMTPMPGSTNAPFDLLPRWRFAPILPATLPRMLH